ncbi:MAG: IS630 family transposase, partial [Verrucomicrobiota bacterium]
NQVERFFAKITNDMIRRGNFRSVPELKEAILTYLETHNQDPRPFKWTATPQAILSKVENICKQLS